MESPHTQTSDPHLSFCDGIVFKADERTAGVVHLEVFVRKHTLAEHLLGEATLHVHHQFEHLRALHVKCCERHDTYSHWITRMLSTQKSLHASGVNT